MLKAVTRFGRKNIRHEAQRLYTNWPMINDDHRMVAEMCRNFAKTELAPIAGITDKEHKFPKEQIEKLGELGIVQ